MKQVIGSNKGLIYRGKKKKNADSVNDKKIILECRDGAIFNLCNAKEPMTLMVYVSS
jgi:hypothetical protein